MLASGSDSVVFMIGIVVMGLQVYEDKDSFSWGGGDLSGVQSGG
jgi:hypothetical protein